MIVIIHNNKEVIQVLDLKVNNQINFSSRSLVTCFFELASTYKNRKIAWCNSLLEQYVNFEALKSCLNVSVKMVSFETSSNFFIDSSIGFIEQTPFVNVKKNVVYPTWLMSSDIGAIKAETLLKFKELQIYNLSFEALLNYISKKGMAKGLLCYSNPMLLTGNFPIISKKQISKSNLFQFIKSNYKYRWVWLYLLNELIYNRKFLLVSFLKSLLKSKISFNITIEQLKPAEHIENKPSLDVLVPTLGREKYLKNVLFDLSKQTLKPTRVIIIEQQAFKNSPSTLNFLKEDWPFEIEHTLIYQLGVCNARNIGLKKLTSNWVFFADDDIRMETDFLEKSFQYIQTYKAKAVTLSCLQKGEIEYEKIVGQWASFGTNASIVKSEYLKGLQFEMALEFGYGEDFDFGMQLRNKGIDILYIPFVKMLHLKAPVGGFRKKIVQDWENDVIIPKPSPTVMLSKIKHFTKEQLQGYKTILFIKFYRKQSVKNPFRYIKRMQLSWDRSTYWANKLTKENEV